MNKVYWIRNNSCTDIFTTGYVGVSKDPEHRFIQHKLKNKRISEDVWMEIIFEGTREQCFAKEIEFRPTKNIGWNRAPGGAQGFKLGFSNSAETKQKLKDAWIPERRARAAIFKSEQNKTFIGQKRPRQSEAIRGKNNPMFGKTHTVESREKIKNANLGKKCATRQEIFCIVCRKRAPMSILEKYHGFGKKNCKTC